MNSVLVKQWANVNGEAGGDDVAEEKPLFRAFMSKLADEQLEEETRSITLARCVTEEERAERIEEIEARYAAADARGTAPPAARAGRSPRNTTPKSRIGRSDALDVRRRSVLKAIMKNRSLDAEEKKRLMKEVKLKYDSTEARERNGADAKEKGQK